jgi:nucleotide-binding universal stress UspA family protein
MYTRILVAIDSSDTAKKALAEAIHLAAACKAKLCVAHALDEGLLAQHALGIGTYLDADKIKAEMRQVAQDLLAGAVATALAGGVAAESRLIESEKKRTAEQIAEAARDWPADLIVVGTHGRHGVERLLVGSVAENLTRLATTSLLMVR